MFPGHSGQTSDVPPAYSSPAAFSFHGRGEVPPPTLGLSSLPSASLGTEEKQSIGGRSRWTDPETRYLLAIWADRYETLKRSRNAKEWKEVAKQLNQQLQEQGITKYRSGEQCRTRMGNLVSNYKEVKDHTNRYAIISKKLTKCWATDRVQTQSIFEKLAPQLYSTRHPHYHPNFLEVHRRPRQALTPQVKAFSMGKS